MHLGTLCIFNEEIFTGSENELNRFVIKIQLSRNSNSCLSFSVNDSNKQYFSSLNRLYDKNLCDYLKNENGFNDSHDLLGLVTGSCGFPVYCTISYYELKYYLVFFSFSERNKGVYSLFLESFCKIIL